MSELTNPTSAITLMEVLFSVAVLIVGYLSASLSDWVRRNT